MFSFTMGLSQNFHECHTCHIRLKEWAVLLVLLGYSCQWGSLHVTKLTNIPFRPKQWCWSNVRQQLIWMSICDLAEPLSVGNEEQEIALQRSQSYVWASFATVLPLHCLSTRVNWQIYFSMVKFPNTKIWGILIKMFIYIMCSCKKRMLMIYR